MWVKIFKKKHWLDILEILKFGGARKVTHMLELLDENRQLDPWLIASASLILQSFDISRTVQKF